MIAHKRYKDSSTFQIYKKQIEIVKSFCYLGLEINSKGNFTSTIDRLHSKAYKSYMGLRQYFNFHNGTSVAVMVRLFQSMVQSILLYGCEI